MRNAVEVVRRRLMEEGFRVDWEETDDEDLIDGLLTVTWHGQEHPFPVVIKSDLTPRRLRFSLLWPAASC